MISLIDTIFISHAHKDEEYAENLVNLIKVFKLDAEIICSSYAGHNVPADENIYDFLKGKLKGNVWVIYLLSENYYKSAACLNEMGATWIQNKQYSTFLTPNFDFIELKGAIDPSKNAYRLDNKNKLNDFKGSIIEQFSTSVNDNIWESVRDEVIKNVNAKAKLELQENSKAKIMVESVSKHEEEGKINVALRLINNYPYKINFTFFKLILKDEKGTSFVIEQEPTNLHAFHEESKIVILPLGLEGSQFSASRMKESEVQGLKFIQSLK